MKKEQQIVLLAVVLIMILGFSVYFNSLKGDFIWDDNNLIKNNTYLRSWSKLASIFSKDMCAGAFVECNYYRPLQMVSYLIDYSFWRLNPLGYHLINVMSHIMVALLIFWLVRILCKDLMLSLLASILFLIHPVNTETVSYLSHRADIFSSLFMLIGIICYIKYLIHEKKSLFLLVLFANVLGLFSKENALIFPALLLLTNYVLKKKVKVKLFLYLLATILVYITIRTSVLTDSPANFSYETNSFKKIPGFFVAIANYLKLLLFPVNLHMEYGTRIFSFFDWRAFLGLATSFFLLIYSFKNKDKDRFTVYLIGWFFVSLIPVSGIYPANAFYMAEHWLYFPSIGLFIFLARALTSFHKNKQFRLAAIIFTVLLIFIWSYFSVKQNGYWKNALGFFERTAKYVPDSPSVLNLLGEEYMDAGKPAEAIALYNRAIENNPKSTSSAYSYISLGNAYSAIGKHEEAIGVFNKLLALGIKKELAYNGLGNEYSIVGKTKEAIESYNKAIEINPDFVFAYNNLASAYKNTGQIDRAIELYKKAIKTDPGYAGAYYNLGTTYKDLKKYEDGISFLRRAVKINPDFAEAYNNLGAIYSETGRIQEAIGAFTKAIKVDSGFTLAYINLANIYFYERKYDLAIKYYDKAIKMGYKAEPDFAKQFESLR